MGIISSGFSGRLSVSSTSFIWCKSIPRYLKLSPFFTVRIFSPLIIKCGSNWTAAVDDFLTPIVAHLLIFTIKSNQLHHFANRFKRYCLSDSKAVIAVSSINCDQCFIMLRVFNVYLRHLTLSWFTVSIKALKHKLSKSGGKLSPCNTSF